MLAALQSARSAPVQPPSFTSRQQSEWASSPDPRDTDAPPAFDSPSMLKAARTLPKVPKDGRTYRVRAKAFGPDGSVYIGYQETSGMPGYVSRADRHGTIRWEAAFESFRSMAVDDAGRCHVVTASDHVVLDAEGTEVGRGPVPGGLALTWVDPGTGDVVGLGKNYRVVMPEGVQGPPERVDGFEPTREGRSIRVRTERGFYEITSRGISWQCPNLRVVKTRLHETRAELAWPLPGGDRLYLVCHREDMPQTPFGPQDGYFYSAGVSLPPWDHVENRSLHRVAPDGTVRWMSASLGDSPRVAVSATGEVMCTGANAYADHNAVVSRLREDGTLQPVARVEGAVSALYYDADALVAEHAMPDGGKAVTRLQADGQTQRVVLPKDWGVQGWTPRGDAFVVDSQGGEAGLVDPRSGELVRLTDAVHDHSLDRVGELRRRAAEVPPVPETTVGDGYVTVGGIRLPVRREG